MTNREIAQEISNRIGNSPVPFDSVYSIALQIYNELGGEATQFDSVYSILLEILPLVASSKDSIVDVDTLPDAELNKGKLLRYEGNLYYAKPEEIKAVKFTALEDSTDISLTSVKSTQIIERSYDAENWVVCVVDDVITLNEGESVYFRGYYTGEAESTNTKFGGTTGKLKLEGNINTLINYTASDLGSNFEVPAYACKSMFGGLKNLVDVSELYLPSMNLSEQCYYYMFVTAPITSAPVLPATKLTSECYRFMFQNCKQLKTAQNIFPATTLAYRSYQSMFMGCSELSNDFTILATTLEDSACLNMFKNAYKVNYIKCLATDISATDCTKTWVDGVAPTGTFVKATSMNDWSTGTSGIPEGWEVANDDTIPEFNYEWHGVYKYNWTELPTKQYVDDAIAAIPQLEAGEGISIINNIISIEPDYLSFKNVGTDTVYITCTYQDDLYPIARGTYQTFQYTKDKKEWIVFDSGSIELQPNEVIYFRGILNTLTSQTDVTFKAFSDSALANKVTTGCLEANGDLITMIDFRNNNVDTVPDYGFYNLFNELDALLKAPKMSANVVGEFACRQMYRKCVNLTEAPVLPATKIKAGGYYSMFRGSGILTAPALPALDLGQQSYYYMFAECASLVKAPELPATSVYYSAYASMFQDCTSLVTPPNILPATDVAYGAYKRMFKGCTALQYTPLIMLSTTVSWTENNGYFPAGSANYQFKANSAVLGQRCNEMFINCTSLYMVRCYTKKIAEGSTNTNNFTDWLSGVSATGFFHCVSGNNFPEGASGIPAGWTVVEV